MRLWKFKKKNKNIIKPLYGNGGEGYFMLRKDSNFNVILENF